MKDVAASRESIRKNHIVGGNTESVRVGLLYGVAAYTCWGIVPLYFKAVHAVPPREMLAHRIVWSALLLMLIMAVAGKLGTLVRTFRSGRVFGFLILSTMFIAANWYVYIYSVSTNQILQGSLGYFILPLVNVAAGTLFFGEKLGRLQWLAIIFASGGVLVLIVWLGMLPWIALTLAVTFSIYGIIRKHVAVDGTIGLTVETLILTPIAFLFLLVWGTDDRLAFQHISPGLDWLIILSGLITTVPLICFGQAVPRLRIVTIGMLQYIAPTLAFLLAVWLYDEAFPFGYQVGYGLIWIGLAIFVADAVRRRNRSAIS